MVLTSTSPDGTSVASEPTRTVGPTGMPLDGRHGLGGSLGSPDEQGDLGGAGLARGPARWTRPSHRHPAPCPRSAAPSHRSRSAANAPGRSVLSACTCPSTRTRVLAAPTSAARSLTRSAVRHRLPLQRHRERQSTPRGVQAAEKCRQSACRHPHARRRTSPVRARRSRRGAAPATASGRSGRRARRTSTQQRPSLSPHHWSSRARFALCSASVAANAVSPVSRLTATK